MKKFLPNRPFMKRVLLVALPLMLQQLITVSVNLIDNLMIGTLGNDAISAVAVVNKYYMIASMAVTGLTAAGAVFVAQFYGAGYKTNMQKSYSSMMSTTVLITLVFMAIGYFFMQPILHYFTNEAGVIGQSVIYMRPALLSYLPYATTLCLYSTIRAIGDTKTPFMCSLVPVVANTFLNYCLIFGHFGFPCLGILGAAVATLSARILEVIVILFIYHHKDYPFRSSLISYIKIDASMTKQVLSKAAPLMTNEMLWSFGMATLFKFYATRGAAVMSGFSIAGTISDLFFTLFAGMAAASTVMISTPLGANRIEEAKENAYHLIGFSAGLAVVFGFMMYSSSLLVGILYNSVSADAQACAMNFIRVQSCLFWLYMATTQCYFILRAGGDMKHTLMMDSGFMWTIMIPVVGCVTYFTSFPYIVIYLFAQATDLIKLFFAYHLVSKEKWAVNLTDNGG